MSEVGPGYSPVTLSGNQLIDPGVTQYTNTLGTTGDTWPVRINLNALNKGIGTTASTGAFGEVQAGDGYLGSTDAVASYNYNKALASQYGLVIFVDGNAAIWGMLPAASGVTNTGKKVTIICTGDAQIMGDVLVSNSRYTAGAITSKTIDPNPLVDNPNQDAIAVLSTGNVYVNPWYAQAPSHFVNEATGATCNNGGDMRIDSFLYTPTGVTGGANGTRTAACPGCGYQQYKAAKTNPGGEGAQNIAYFTFHGAIAVNTSGYLPGCSGYSRIYDPQMKYNVSSIIPAGTSVASWQEDIDPPLDLWKMTPAP